MLPRLWQGGGRRCWEQFGEDTGWGDVTVKDTEETLLPKPLHLDKGQKPRTQSLQRPKRGWLPRACSCRRHTRRPRSTRATQPVPGQVHTAGRCSPPQRSPGPEPGTAASCQLCERPDVPLRGGRTWSRQCGLVTCTQPVSTNEGQLGPAPQEPRAAAGLAATHPVPAASSQEGASQSPERLLR